MRNISAKIAFSFFYFLTSTAFAQIVDVSSVEEYEKELKDSSKQIFVQFIASWCSPCRLVSSEEEYWNKKVDNKVKIIKVDIQKIPELSRRYEVNGIPFMNMMDYQGNVLLSKIGAKSIIELLASYEKMLQEEHFSLLDFINQAQRAPSQ